ncbi:MAG TPA: ATP-binding protein [Roseiflexaceae bacterium]|nr:ATP-binding protein [Roseiflexaceae bacterium]
MRKAGRCGGAVSPERERARVASEIHDGLGGHLSTLKVHLEIAASTVEEDPAKAAAAFTIAEEEAAAAQRELRRAVEALNAGTMAQPLDVLLATLARTTEHTGLRTTLAIHGAVRPLAQPAQHALYRIAQEALHNAQRHASATLVEIELDFRVHGEVQLRISDNGVGLPASHAAQPQGHGLRNMHNRVQPLGGTLEITSQPYQGVRLWVTLPLTGR